MTRLPPRVRRRAAALPDPSLRHLWLAGLGGLVVVQRTVGNAVRLARQEVERRLRRTQAS